MAAVATELSSCSWKRVELSEALEASTAYCGEYVPKPFPPATPPWSTKSLAVPQGFNKLLSRNIKHDLIWNDPLLSGYALMQVMRHDRVQTAGNERESCTYCTVLQLYLLFAIQRSTAKYNLARWLPTTRALDARGWAPQHSSWTDTFEVKTVG